MPRLIVAVDGNGQNFISNSIAAKCYGCELIKDKAMVFDAILYMNEDKSLKTLKDFGRHWKIVKGSETS